MSFALFLLLNAILLIRPEDFLPDLAGTRLYLIIIAINLFVSLPSFVAQFRPEKLVRRPITVCVLGLLVAAFLSQAVHGQVGVAVDFVSEFAKVVAYFLLFIAVVNTPGRLRAFIGFLVALIVVVALLGVLQMHEVIDYEALKPVMQQQYDPEVGEMVAVPRLCGPGVFNDPNDICLVLSLGILCCLYRAATATNNFFSALWLAPIALYGYAIVLTKSRGGLLGLLAGLGALMISKYGWRRAMPLVIVGLPALVFAIGGRQSNISLGSDDTGHARVMLWAAGLSELFSKPAYIVTGIGTGEYSDAAGGQVAHNSFVHAYVELGMLGGTLFLTGFALAIRMLYALRPVDHPVVSPEFAKTLPFVMAMIVAGAAGMYSLSRNYQVPTYMYLAIAESFLLMAMPAPPAAFRVSQTWVKQTTALGVGGLVFLKLFTQFAGSLGM